MKVQRFLLIGAAILLASASQAWAQRVQVQIQPAQVQPKLILQPRGDAPLLTPEGVEKLKLTNDQKEKYTKIESDYKDLVKTAQDTFRNTIQGDRTKVREAQQKQQADTSKAREDQLGKVEAILTGEQKTVFAQVKQDQPRPGPGGVIRPQPIGGGGIGQILPPAMQNRLQLTDEQKKQLEALQKEVDAKLMKILTDEQKKQVEQFKKGPVIRPLPIQPVQPNPRIQPVPNVRPVQPAVEPRRE